MDGGVGEEVQEGGDICIHIAALLCCTAETNTALQNNYTQFFFLKAKVKRWKHRTLQVPHHHAQPHPPVLIPSQRWPLLWLPSYSFNWYLWTFNKWNHGALFFCVQILFLYMMCVCHPSWCSCISFSLLPSTSLDRHDTTINLFIITLLVGI